MARQVKAGMAGQGLTRTGASGLGKEGLAGKLWRVQVRLIMERFGVSRLGTERKNKGEKANGL